MNTKDIFPDAQTKIALFGSKTHKGDETMGGNLKNTSQPCFFSTRALV